MLSVEPLFHNFSCSTKESHLSKKRFLTAVVVCKQEKRPSRGIKRVNQPKQRLNINGDPETTDKSVFLYPTLKRKGSDRELLDKRTSHEKNFFTSKKPSNAWWDESDFLYDEDENQLSGKRKLTSLEGNKKMQKCVKTGNIEQAQVLFDLMRKEGEGLDVFGYVTLMNGYCKAGNDTRVFDLFDEMISEGIQPDVTVLNVLVNTCAITTNLEKADDLLSNMEKNYDIQPDLITFNSALKVCAKAGDVPKAKHVYEEMRQRGISGNVITFSTLVGVFARATNSNNGKEYLKECERLLETMQREKIPPNRRTYNYLIKICIRAGMTEEAFEVLERMDEDGVSRDSYTYSMLISGCAKSVIFSAEQLLSKVDKLQKQMQTQQLVLDSAIYSTLFGVCLRVDDLQKAQEYYEEAMQTGVKLNSVAYGALIKCYEKLGDPSDRDSYLNPCFEIVEYMENHDLRMDAYLYTSLISACGNVKDIHSALEFWEKMKNKDIIPSSMTFGALIKAYLSVDDIDAAIRLLDAMEASKIKPQLSAFRMLFFRYEKKRELSKARLLWDKMQSYDMEPDQSLLEQLSRMNLV